MSSRDVGPGKNWYDNAFDQNLVFSEIGYDRKFCQLLRAGIEDPLVVLLLALVPNIKTIILHGVPVDANILEWRASHEFSGLKQFTACARIPPDC